MFGLGWQELLIILAVALLLFGGTRLAGLGKASGRAIREFKEETRDLKSTNKPDEVRTGELGRERGAGEPFVDDTPRVQDAEVVEDRSRDPRS